MSIPAQLLLSGSNACRPVVIHAVLRSIIFENYKQLTKLIDQKKGDVDVDVGGTCKGG